jgi:omega-6 fatty acid desaturase (delta-12 desaturase)
MRQGSELVRSTKKFAVESRSRSYWHFWSTLLVFLGTLMIACWDLPWPVRLCGSFLTAFTLVRIFIIYHDYLHGTILQDSWVAFIVMRAFGIFSLNPPSVWKRSHNHHHQHNSKTSGSGIGSFPLMTTEVYAKSSWKVRFNYAMARHPLIMVFGYLTMFLYGMCLRPLFLNPRVHFDAAIYLILHLSLIAVLAFLAPDLLLFAVLIPLMMASAIGSYLFYAQHNFPGVKLKFGSDWNYVSAALESSSFIRMNPVLHWFTGNIGFHHVHHLNAHIPFYRLPEAMVALEELQSPKMTYLTPVSIYRCLRLKLWDMQKDCMVNFQGN